jgi:hypothetical protein
MKIKHTEEFKNEVRQYWNINGHKLTYKKYNKIHRNTIDWWCNPNTQKRVKDYNIKIQPYIHNRYLENRKIFLTNAKKFYDNKKDFYKQQYQNNRDIFKQKSKNYRLKNIDRITKKCRLYYQKNRKLCIERNQTYIKNRLKVDPLYRLITKMRTRTGLGLKGYYKCAHTEQLLGCSFEKLKIYLESKFLPGMTWQNHTIYGWHVDHIKPLASFNLSKPEEQYKAFNYNNLQPLWGIDNLVKSSIYEGVLYWRGKPVGNL